MSGGRVEGGEVRSKEGGVRSWGRVDGGGGIKTVNLIPGISRVSKNSDIW